MHHSAGALGDAERCYRQLLAALPSHAEAHGRLGAVLMRQGKMAEAIFHIEHALSLRPDMFEAYGSLCQAYLWTGQRERATEAACRALDLRETPQSKAMFAQCVSSARFAPDAVDKGRYRKFVLRALVEGWVRPRELAGVSIGLIRLNSAVKDAVGRIDAVWPKRLPPRELFGAAGIAALAQDELFCRLLESDPITDLSLERLLTDVRYAMLKAANDESLSERLVGFYCSVARQCFINEYVFATTADEAEEAHLLRTALEQKLSAGATYPKLWPVTVGAYCSLHTLKNAQALLDRPAPPSIAALLAQQVAESAEEKRIAAAIPALTEITGEVSCAVRRQYEENPYPRWTMLGPPAQSAASFAPPAQQQNGDALIAGCGTGLSTVEFARHFHAVRILAVDLSLASLSYAKRMAGRAGLTNVEFAQADIMKLGALGRQFDFIDASGVLHHLADPWEGWRILLSLLRPGGAMQVGLYSELARRNVVAARALIAERGYRPVAEDIRRCRADIMAAADPLLKSISRGNDFFTIGECRDLLFHVQEHRVALPAIKSFLMENGAEFRGFFLDVPVQQRFASRFPQAGAALDLDRWHTFETEAPDTFAGMYQFSVGKPAASHQ